MRANVSVCVRKCESLKIISSNEHHQLHGFPQSTHTHTILFPSEYLPFWQMLFRVNGVTPQ